MSEKITREEYQREKVYGQKYKLNFWNIWTDRPYISVAIVVALIITLFTRWYLGTILILLITAN